MPTIARQLGGLLLLAVILLPARAGDGPFDSVFERIQRFFPAAERVGTTIAEAQAAPVYGAGELIGYVFFADHIIRIPAYSGKPIHTLVGLDLQARIAGVSIVSHEEPILAVGISDADLQRFIDQYRGLSVEQRIKIGGGDREGHHALDGISGATITVMVLNASISRAARKVAAALELPRATGAGPGAGSIVGQAVSEQPVWVDVWNERRFQIAVLSVGLVLLLVVLFLQDWLARHPSLLRYLRTGYLVFTLFFIGWYALAQLSIVNVLTFVHAVIHEFSWDSFMVDPMMFILWSFVAMTVLLWGRGVYCGWLCPFGALQELSFRVAKRLRIPSFEFSEVVHERLWAIKYMVLLVLFGVSLQSMKAAGQMAEVEPFKTAITLRFQREWGYLLYAGALLAIGLFNRKFFCRYLCPLGAALTFPGRFRIFDWLRRRKECGKPCQICARECEVRAITPTGEINPNECQYCLDCQVTYWDDRTCPPLVERRRKRERAARARAPEVTLAPASRASEPGD